MVHVAFDERRQFQKWHRDTKLLLIAHTCLLTCFENVVFDLWISSNVFIKKKHKLNAEMWPNKVYFLQ